MVWDPDYKERSEDYEDPDAKELRTFYSKAWSTRCDPVALTEFMRAMKNHPHKRVTKALREIFREQDRSVRPSIKQVFSKVYELGNRDRLIEADNLAGPSCAWCSGRQVYYVFIYPVSSSELPDNFIPTAAQKDIMKQKNKNWWLVKPAAAKKKGMNRHEERLWCHHCQVAGDKPSSYHALGNSVKEFISKFDDYIDWDRTGPRGIIDRLFESNPPHEKILTQEELSEAMKEFRNGQLIQEIGSNDDTEQSEDFSQDVKKIIGPGGPDRDRSGPAS